MLPFIITKKEVTNYFSEFGYECIDNLQLIQIYSKKYRDFMYLPSRRYYWKGFIWFTLLVNHKILGTGLRTEWYRFNYIIHLNRYANKPSKTK